MSIEQRPPFTMGNVTWRPWVETVDDVGATPEQAALVTEVAPSPDGRAYYATLAHDPLALRERTGLFNAVMYGPRGARRSDRELAAVAASLINGCVYCTSVHARRFVQLTKETGAMQRLLDEGVDTELGEQEQAVVAYAGKLTRDPEGMTAADLAPLRRLGMSDMEILDVTHATAMFAWANRLMQTLGESVLPADTPA
ncbi:MAG: peroxidase-related enzyme [Chloroflexota bacterium]|nr:peroxidase-related enzyme [Chloroflexota bacterium]